MSLRLLAFLFCSIFSFSAFSQQANDYASSWKKVAEWEKKGLTKSALEEVIIIYQQAAKSANTPQQIKAVMFQIKFRNMVEEDASQKNIAFVDSLISKASIPAKNILLSMQAEMLWRFKQNNSWKFYNRTALQQEISTDISTWSLSKINQRITQLYSASLQNESVLKNTPVSQYAAILDKGENTRALRPTLYDFLAFRALEFFSSSENDITKPAYTFIINDEKFFSTATNFASLYIQSNDTASLYQQALNIYQQLIRFHLKDATPSALIDADLLRLDFIYQHGVFTDKDKLYEQALLKFQQQYKSSEVAQAMYLRAQLYVDLGNNFSTTKNPASRFLLMKAKVLCDSIINTYPKSIGAINGSNLRNQIIAPSINMEVEKVNLPAQPFRALVKYKATETISLRIIKLNREDVLSWNKIEDEDNRWKNILNKKPLKEWTLALPDQKDYQEHSTEIKIDPLDNGMYYIISSIKNDFSLSGNVLTKQLVYVSNISYLHNNEKDYYVLHRKTGAPLANAQVQMWNRNYNYNLRNYEYVKSEKYSTDKNGHFSIPSTKEYRSFQLQIQYEGDELFMDDEMYQPVNYPANKPKPQTILFTDRSIYRPGQTIYFKGIVHQQDSSGKNAQALKSFVTKVFLINVNNQKVGSVAVTTNGFGSYNGRFEIPTSQLNGQFYLKDSVTNAMQYVQVEEYKRPTFSVEIKTPAYNYQLNDSVHISGNAKAYAGNNIVDAKVVYRVVRKIHYPYPWLFSYKIWPPNGNRDEMEITNGITTTQTDGSFSIHFKAIPDESIDKNSKPVFQYEISADVTDINGETRSKTTNVSAAWHNLQLDILLPNAIQSNRFDSLKINSTNINGIFTKALVKWKVEKLQTPSQIFRERFWPVPDVFVINKETFQTLFPNDAYQEENKIENWPVISTILQHTDSTKENNAFKLNSTWEPGWYKVTAASTDKNGIAISVEKYIQLTDPLNKKLNNSPLQIISSNSSAQPGDKVAVSIATGFNNISLIRQIRKSNIHTIEVKNISSQNPDEQIINIKESDRGGIQISYAFIKNNCVYSGSEYISIPYTNKELKISFETFRDKLLPGSKEEWKMSINGTKGEKVASELLVSMYDASLDQFRLHNWNNLSYLWPTISASSNFTALGFLSIDAEQLNRLSFNWLTVPPKSYDQFLAAVWETVFYSRYGSFGWADGRAAAAPMTAAVKGNLTVEDQMGMKEKKSEESDKTVSRQILSDSTKTPKPPADDVPVQIRKNFNETAFFFPNLVTDSLGNISFSFTIPEALTKWKLLALAHSPEMSSGYAEKTLVTQKELMVQPNMPRFMRQGDKAEFPVKVVNLSGKELTGTVQLELFDAANNKPVDGWLKNIFPVQYFTVAPYSSFAILFPVEIPIGFTSVLGYRFKAISTTKENTFSDGEENAIPVLSNRLLVTESLPLNMRNSNSKTFRFDKLLNSGNSGTLTHQLLTVEYTSNPMWYVVQALPYLNTLENESSDQLFNKLYANALAAHIVKNYPAIRNVFEKWRIRDTAALISNLSKNEELKSILLQETPWVFDAENETQQKKNISLLFDMVQMTQETAASISKLAAMQLPNGGFSWFKDGPDDRYITQSILTGLGRLKHLQAMPSSNSLDEIINKGLRYLDNRIKEDYALLIKNKTKLNQNNLSAVAVQYLYMRSFFSQKIPADTKKGYDYYFSQTKTYWLSQSKLLQAMIALTQQRAAFTSTAISILKSLQQNAIVHPELGMYWKEFNTGGYYWHQSPIESQALIIEAFTEIDKNPTIISDLRTWLLKQKQTQNWRSSKATADACYALLLDNRKENDVLQENPRITIQLGNTTFNSTDQTLQEGTGYFKQTVAGDKIQQGMGNIQVIADQKTPGATSWGAVYWQYFEDMDKVTAAATPLQLIKKLFVEKNTDKGPVLVAVNDGDEMQIGDKVKVRIELKVDRNMEYIHMKDMRSAAMEPVNVVSSYKYQDGLSYYESTKDASTNFFFNWLPRGTYVFEYPMFITQSGNFSNGITTIQCLYAPEFSSHTNGVRINIAAKK